MVEIKRGRIRKEAGQRPQVLPRTEATGGRLVEKTFTEEAARNEAARCMQCSTVCDKCVEVCPNRANYTYIVGAVKSTLPTIAYENGKLVVIGEELFKVAQTRQIVHLHDFCNECGNCASFCVHHGKPYQDKPRLFLQECDFKLEDNNAFYITGNTIRSRDGGMESKLKIRKDGFIFKNHLVLMSLSIDFKIKEMTLERGFGGVLSLRKVAEMSLLFNGITTSLPFLFEDWAK